MKSLQLQMYLLIWFEAVKGLKIVKVELGQNVTVNCDLSSTELYWYMQIQCRAPVLILRAVTVGKRIKPHYENAVLKQKFSLINYSLLIYNITEEELGDYYCLKPGEPFFTDGTRLHTTKHVNKTEQDDQRPSTPTPWPVLTLTSALLNCVFIAAIAALLASHCKRSPDSNLQQPQDQIHTQYDTTDLYASARRVKKQCGAPELILRSVSRGEEKGHYYNTIFRQRFLLQVNNSLLIPNITEDELGDYYCVETGKPIVFSNGLRLNSTGRTSETANKTEQRDQQPPQHTPWPSLTLASALLNCIFIIPVIALLTSHCKKSSKDRLQPPDPNLQRHQDLKSEEYAEINLPTSDRGVTRCQENSIYALLQHPSP
ncbi:hypothetical protein MHYP_G00301560 [Metynnis hypsauchen]